MFKTTDYGQTWKPIAGNLPAFGWVNSIRQDPVNRNLLYAPTEFGFYISLDDGARLGAVHAESAARARRRGRSSTRAIAI